MHLKGCVQLLGCTSFWGKRGFFCLSDILWQLLSSLHEIGRSDKANKIRLLQKKLCSFTEQTCQSILLKTTKVLNDKKYCQCCALITTSFLFYAGIPSGSAKLPGVPQSAKAYPGTRYTSPAPNFRETCTFPETVTLFSPQVQVDRLSREPFWSSERCHDLKNSGYDREDDQINISILLEGYSIVHFWSISFF